MRPRTAPVIGVIGAGLTVATLVGCSGSDAPSGAPTPSVTDSSVGPTGAPIELTPGQGAAVGELRVTASSPRLEDAVSEGLARGRFLVIDVELTSLGPTEVGYGPRSWTLVPTGGAAISAYPIADADRLDFGTLAPGATVAGAIAFELGAEAGPATLEFHPSVGGAAAATMPVAW